MFSVDTKTQILVFEFLPFEKRLRKAFWGVNGVDPTVEIELYSQVPPA